ncbi:MAG: ribonuclease E [Halieaceae bacterium]|nr:ribonuclease E [Halieaceae bacterium]
MKKMLINATQPEELRVALVDGQRLYDLDIENRTRVQKKSNVYKGRITRVEPSLEAAFVDFGAERHGFLPMKEIAKEYFSRKGGNGESRPRIKDLVKEGTEVIVQVDKEERGNKGAALTTYISLAGRYMVLMPNNPKAGGISRRIEGDDRSELREAMSGLEIPKGMGVIIRTAGIGRSSEELQWDLDYLVQVWEAIEKAGEEEKAPSLLLQESNVIVRAIRDYLREDIDQVLIDSPDAHQHAESFVSHIMPQYKNRLRLYEDQIPMFNRFQIESQIETAFQREVRLPSGGSIVIDPTEAMVSIDINSARATKGSDIEETALQTNLEAADEIARQLRLRDIGGLIVIDFIDMMASRNQRAVENRMRDALKIDRARVQLGRISRFGLLEMSRQRLRPSLGETSAIVCPRCNGQGTIRDTKSLALAILRLLEEEAIKERSAEVRAVVPVPVATYLLNEKRAAIAEIEELTKVRVVVLANPAMETPHFEVERLRDDQIVEKKDLSFEIDITPEEEEVPADVPVDVPQERAAVQSIAPSTPAPEAAPAQARPQKEQKPEAKKRDRKSQQKRAPAKKPGFFARLFGFLGGEAAEEESRDKGGKKRGKQARGKQERDDKDGQRSRNRRRGGRGRRRGGEGQRGDAQRGDAQRADSPREQDGRQKDARKRDDARRDDARRDDKRGKSQDNEQRRDAEPRRGEAEREGGSGEETRSRRRRGGRGRRRSEEGAPQQQAREATDNIDSDEAQDKPRKRPSDQRSADKPRRRRRGKRPQDDEAVQATDATPETGSETPAEPLTEAPVAADMQPAPAVAEIEETTEAMSAEAPVTAEEPAVAEQAPSEQPSEELTAQADESEVEDSETTYTAAPESETDVAVAEAAAEAAVETTAESVAEESALDVVAVAEPEPVETPVAEQAVAGAESSGGRAWNDPRVTPKPVASVSIDTAHPVFFRADIAPPVVPVKPQPPRAINDPRGPAGAGSDSAPVSQ